MLLLLVILLPMLAGILLLAVPALRGRMPVRLVSSAAFAVTAVLAIASACQDGLSTPALTITDSFVLVLSLDGMGKLFSVLSVLIVAAAGVYAFVYMTHGEREWQFFGFFLLTEGALLLISYAGSLVTFYFGYELMTLVSLPLVLHERTAEAVEAGKKYLYYSSFGALCGLFGIFALTPSLTSAGFTPGGSLSPDAGGWSVLTVTFVMLLGFGVKAGLFPLHGWLPTAHPVAPAPASGVLSGLITKAGVLGVIRTIYYTVGPELLRGSWVQWVYAALAVITVIMGSAMALKEDVLKKRLAYSTVSQVSYMLLGLISLNASGITGALTHLVFHSIIKNALFLIAGAIIFKTGLTRASEMTALGKKMPITIWSWLLVSLGLVGIPPMSGFISKWYLMQGTLSGLSGVLSYLAPAALILSALLTAGYLLPLPLRGFFVGKDGYKGIENLEPAPVMVWPIVLLAAATVYFGILPGGLLSFTGAIASGVLL